MPISPFYRAIRDRVGTDLLLMPAVAALVRDEHDRVLVQRTRHGNWSLPAGAVDPGEPPAQALVREVFEETGLRVRPERVLGVFGGPSCRVTYPNGDRVEYACTLFACTPVSGELIDENEETELVQWFAPEQMPELGFPYPKQVFEQRHATSVYFEWDDAWLDALK